jgi:hypothetical protein
MLTWSRGAAMMRRLSIVLLALVAAAIVGSPLASAQPPPGFVSMDHDFVWLQPPQGYTQDPHGALRDGAGGIIQAVRSAMGGRTSARVQEIEAGREWLSRVLHLEVEVSQHSPFAAGAAEGVVVEAHAADPAARPNTILIFNFGAERRNGLVISFVPRSATPEDRRSFATLLATMIVPPSPEARALALQRAGFPFSYADAPGLTLVSAGPTWVQLSNVEIGDPFEGPAVDIRLMVLAPDQPPTNAEEQIALAPRRILGPGFTELQADSVQPARIGGVDGVELRGRAAYCGTNPFCLRRPGAGQPMRILGWIGFLPEGRAIRVFAAAPEAEFDAVLPELEATMRSLRPRD